MLAAVADAEKLPLSDLSVDLVVGSPPYCDARTYGIGADRDCIEWVEWMLRVTAEAQRVCRGPVIWVAAGVTRDRNYWPACEGLMWEWWKRGGDCQLYRPVFWHRSSIPGSGGDDWFRSDVEYCMCFKRPGALPWSDNTAMGHKPKWPAGGKLSYRDANGKRRHKIRGVSGYCDGDVKQYRASEGNLLDRAVTEIANPGNLIRTNNGGGQLGSKVAHENEAPFPEKVPEFFIRSLCPPGGIVCDPFCGSGTTAAAAIATGRVPVMFDIRQSQVELTRKRIGLGVQMALQ